MVSVFPVTEVHEYLNYTCSLNLKKREKYLSQGVLYLQKFPL